MKKECYQVDAVAISIKLEREYYPPTPPATTGTTVVKVLSDDNDCWTLIFVDADGNPVGEPVTGQGSTTLNRPDGAVDEMVEKVDCEASRDPGTTPQALPRPFISVQFLEAENGVDPSGSYDWYDLLQADPARRLAGTVKAISSAGAQATWNAIKNAGPGAPVPPNVDISAFVVADVLLQGFMISSSLPEAISTFTVDVDGVLIADLGSALNVTVSPLPNGWYEITTLVPYAALEGGAVLTIDQTAPEAGNYHNVFEF